MCEEVAIFRSRADQERCQSQIFSFLQNGFLKHLNHPVSIRHFRDEKGTGAEMGAKTSNKPRSLCESLLVSVFFSVLKRLMSDWSSISSDMGKFCQTMLKVAVQPSSVSLK